MNYLFRGAGITRQEKRLNQSHAYVRMLTFRRYYFRPYFRNTFRSYYSNVICATMFVNVYFFKKSLHSRHLSWVRERLFEPLGCDLFFSYFLQNQNNKTLSSSSTDTLHSYRYAPFTLGVCVRVSFKIVIQSRRYFSQSWFLCCFQWIIYKYTNQLLNNSIRNR